MDTYDCISVKAALNGSFLNQKIKINGWVKKSRNQKDFSFIELNDGSIFSSIQIIAKNNIDSYNDVLKLSTGCSISVYGTLIKSLGGGQEFEIEALDVTVLGFVDNPETYPISPKPHTLEHLRENAHLRARSNIGGAITRIRSAISFAIHSFFNKKEFFLINTPIITASDCEGAGEMFKVSTLDFLNLPKKNDQIDYTEDFFGQASFLTVSGQLNAETYACALSKVYTFGPTFRAENSNTSRHLAEFWMVEPEVAFSNLKDNAALAEEMLKFISNYLLENCMVDLSFFQKQIDKLVITRLENLAKSNFVHMDYSDGIDVLKKASKKFENEVNWGIDLASEHERYLSEEYVKSPVVLMNYPKEIKSFYMRLNDDGKTVAAMDVLAPGIGEIIGGSQREERLDVLTSRMSELGLSEDHYKWYLDLRRYGTVPHAGFGLGLERLISYVTGVGNVRDVIAFPRTPNNIKF